MWEDLEQKIEQAGGMRVSTVGRREQALIVGRHTGIPYWCNVRVTQVVIYTGMLARTEPRFRFSLNHFLLSLYIYIFPVSLQVLMTTNKIDARQLNDEYLIGVLS